VYYQKKSTGIVANTVANAIAALLMSVEGKDKSFNKITASLTMNTNGETRMRYCEGLSIVFHKKRGSTFVIITLEKLVRFFIIFALL